MRIKDPRKAQSHAGTTRFGSHSRCMDIAAFDLSSVLYSRATEIGSHRRDGRAARPGNLGGMQRP